jgi:hypothetical protein
VAPLAVLASTVDSAPVGEVTRTLAACGLLVLAFLLAGRALHAFTGRHALGALAVAVAGLAVWFASTANFYVNTSPWLPAGDDEDVFAERLDAERVLFEQPARIDAAIAALQDGGPGPHAWFRGFAGYGEQRVFAEEVVFAARAIGARYGTDGRPLQRVNDRRDLERYPLAGVTGLRRARCATLGSAGRS